MNDRPSRRALLAVAATAGLTACAGLRRGSPFFSTVTNTGARGTASSIRAYADSLPYASLLFWFEGQAKSLIILSTIDPGERLTWASSERSLTTYGPFVVATAGTEVELRETRFGPGWSTDLRTLDGKTLERTALVARKGEATTRLRSHFRRGGTELVKLLDGKRVLTRIDESVVANERSRLLNSYWIDDATGHCLRSRQSALPTMQPLNIEVVKFPDGT